MTNSVDCLTCLDNKQLCKMSYIEFTCGPSVYEHKKSHRMQDIWVIGVLLPRAHKQYLHVDSSKYNAVVYAEML